LSRRPRKPPDATSQLADSGQARCRVPAGGGGGLNEQYAFVFDLADELPDEQVSQLQDVLDTTQKAADDLGIANFPLLPTPTDGVTETPKEAPTPTDTPTPPEETAAPTEAPSPTPTAPAQTDG
jgi:hypothetical protein